MLARFFMLIILLACSCGLLRADCTQLDDALITEIVSNDHSSLWDLIFGDGRTESHNSMRINEEKIYLNPENIIPTDQGLFLNLNNQDYIVLPPVYSDECGCYIKPLFNTSVTKTCPNCGWEYLAVCKNPDCPGKEKAKNQEKEKKDKKRDYQEKKDKKKK